MARSMVLLSMCSRNFTLLPKCSTAVRFCYSSNLIKDEIEKTSKSKQIFNSLSDNQDISSIVASIEANKKTTDGRTLVNALNFIQQEQKDIHPEIVHNHPEFQKLCNILQTNLIGLDVPQLLSVLKSLSLLQVPSNTRIMQSLLQLISQSINNFSLNQIIFLTYMLSYIKDTHLTVSLKKALPEVFKAQLYIQIDRTDLHELCECLRYTCFFVKDEKSIIYIIDIINDKHRHLLNVEYATKILLSLANIDHIHIASKSYFNVLNCALDALRDNLNQLDKKQTKQIMSKIFKKLYQGHHEFYRPLLMQEIINKTLKEKWTFREGILILNNLNKIQYISEPFLNYLVQECIKDSDILAYQELNITTLMQGLSHANFKPTHWNKLKEIVLKNYPKISLSHPSLSYFALNLASLDSFDTILLDKIFGVSDINVNLLSDEYHKCLQELYQAVKTLYPAYTGPWPPNDLIQTSVASKITDNRRNPFYFSLERILGDPSYIKSKVKTNLGHCIDHLVIFKDGHPITVESIKSTENLNYINLENLIIPPDCKKMAILLLPSQAYAINKKNLVGRTTLNIKSLEAMSFTVVHIPIDSWLNMPDHERIPYIELLIGYKSKDVNPN